MMRRLAPLLDDVQWALAHPTLAADLTTLRDECRFACSDSAVVARFDGLPFVAASFMKASASGASAPCSFSAVAFEID